jgi:hypothetical protein
MEGHRNFWAVDIIDIMSDGCAGLPRLPGPQYFSNGIDQVFILLRT